MMRHAAGMVAVVGLFVFGVQALVSTAFYQLGGGDHLSNSLGGFDRVATVDLGQGKPLTDAQRFLKETAPEIFDSAGQIVSFEAEWCGACRGQKIQLRALERRFNVLIYDVDDPKGKILYEYFEGNSVPLTLVLEGGEVKKRWEGYTSAVDIEQFALPAKKVGKDEKTRPFRFGSLRIGWYGPAVFVNSGRTDYRHPGRIEGNPLRYWVPPSVGPLTTTGHNHGHRAATVLARGYDYRADRL